MGRVYCPVCQAEYPPDWKACPKDACALLRSATIGKYRIEGLLGVGGMGAVYRATNPDIRGSRVAIKVMNPAVANAEATRERFKREAATVAALRTAHVVKVFDFDADVDGSLYLVMELLDGHPLRAEIEPAPDTMDLSRVQMVMDGALKGLAAAHRAGVVHRDLKPENIFIAETDDGEVVKLLDFGIARVKSTDKQLTHSGSMMGTASYMAIEQIAANAGEVGPWTDVYAMGAILYEMLAGAPAYGGSTVTEVLQRVLKTERVPLAAVRSGLPEPVYAVVEQALAAEPAARPQDAEALRVALRDAQLVAPGTAVAPPSKTRPHAPKLSFAGDVAMMPTATPVPPSAPTHSQVALAATTPIEPRPRARWPWLALALVLAAGSAIAIVVAVSSGGSPARTDAREAPFVMPDAPTPPDAATPVDGPSVDATTQPITAGMIEFETFWIDAREMTLGELRAALREPKLGGVPGDTPDLPARRVSWQHADAACKALGKRLPSEREWELAAKTTPGDGKRASLCSGCPRVKPTLVAARGQDCSEAGLCDMLGSVIEWTSDAVGEQRVVRGASYKVAPNAGFDASLAFRAAVPAAPDEEVGFRCVYGRSP